MSESTIIDWTDAFDNSGYVEGSAALPNLWAARAEAYRAARLADRTAELGLAYGPGRRNRLDLFRPQGAARGLVVFVHGGYWHRMDRAAFSHLAEGPRARGWTVAMPSYTLAPEVRIGAIVAEIAAAIAHAAAAVDGPIRLAGHSAGGHLVTRMACADSPLPDPVAARLEGVLSISGIHDLRPLLLSTMNKTLGLDAAEAEAESPARRAPRTDLPVHATVGAAERPELMRQTRLLAEVWGRRGAQITDSFLPGEDHFTIIEGLADAGSGMVARLVG